MINAVLGRTRKTGLVAKRRGQKKKNPDYAGRSSDLAAKKSLTKGKVSRNHRVRKGSSHSVFLTGGREMKKNVPFVRKGNGDSSRKGGSDE